MKMLRRVVWKSIFINLWINMLKVSKKVVNFFVITSKLVKILIFISTIAFIWSLGIYNCYKDHREVEKSDIKKFFIILGINMLKFSKKYWNLFVLLQNWSKFWYSFVY